MWDAAVSSQQGVRRSMEDSYYLDINFAGKGWCFGGVYDGHLGAYASVYAATHLHQRVLEQINYGQSIDEAFIKAYESISEEIGLDHSGTTAVNFLVRNTHITSANVGDSRALVIGKNHVRQLTTDHRLDNPQEFKRLRQLGTELVPPYVMRQGQGLMPTRTLGDPFFKPVGVIAFPEVSTTFISDDEFAVVAGCDGLFDFMTNSEVAEEAREAHQAQELVQRLEQEILYIRKGMDNLTIICVMLSPCPAGHNAA